MATKKSSASDWAAKFNRPETAKTPQSVPAGETPVKVRTAQRKSVKSPPVAPERRMVAYRLSEEAVGLIEDAVYVARKAGEKLTKEQAVEQAILATYRKSASRKSVSRRS